MTSVRSLRRQLRGHPTSSDPDYWADIAKAAAEANQAAREAGDPDTANKLWFLGSVARARALMCQVFADLQAHEYKEAWMVLEQVEILVAALQRNPFLSDEFEIAVLGKMVERWQSQYPYTVFASPEMIVKRSECSICGRPTDPFDHCGHEKGKVYAGQYCSRIIREFEAVSIALVRDPVQKYSVMIPEPDPHSYTKVRYIAERVSNPFSLWRVEHTTAFHDHDLFAGWPEDGDCPCHSGRSYGNCCRARPGVLMPHDVVIFSEPIPWQLAQCVVRVRESPAGEMKEVVGTYPDRLGGEPQAA